MNIQYCEKKQTSHIPHKKQINYSNWNLYKMSYL